MPYNHLTYETIDDPELVDVFHDADMLFHDVYGMFKLPEAVNGDGGGCNFPIALVLLCVIDGLASEVYPTRLVEKQKKRFTQFIRDKLWPNGKLRDFTPNEGANVLYREFRNSLVHELGGNHYAPSGIKTRPEGVAGKWGLLVPEENWNIEHLDAVDEWPENWPVLYKNELGAPKLCCAALFWTLKRTVMDHMIDCEAMQLTMDRRKQFNACEEAKKAAEPSRPRATGKSSEPATLP